MVAEVCSTHTRCSVWERFNHGSGGLFYPAGSAVGSRLGCTTTIRKVMPCTYYLHSHVVVRFPLCFSGFCQVFECAGFSSITAFFFLCCSVKSGAITCLLPFCSALVPLTRAFSFLS